MSSIKEDYKNIHIFGRRGRQNLESELCSGQWHCSVLSKMLSLAVLATPLLPLYVILPCGGSIFWVASGGWI